VSVDDGILGTPIDGISFLCPDNSKIWFIITKMVAKAGEYLNKHHPARMGKLL
jgi:hypothetical protein